MEQKNLRGAQSDGGINQKPRRASRRRDPAASIWPNLYLALIWMRSKRRGGHAWSLWRGASGSRTRNFLRSAGSLANSIRLGPNPYGEPFNKQFPEINVISNVIENGKPIGNLGAGEAVWHADMTYIDVPPKAAVLYSLEVPHDGGGNTHFADMFAAYEALPAALKQTIEGKVAVHDASRNSAGCCARDTRR